MESLKYKAKVQNNMIPIPEDDQEDDQIAVFLAACLKAKSPLHDHDYDSGYTWEQMRLQMMKVAKAADEDPDNAPSSKAFAATAIVCNFCHKKGHKEADCHKKKKGSKKKNQSTAEPSVNGEDRIAWSSGAPEETQCFRCKQFGHYKKDSPNPAAETKKKGTTRPRRTWQHSSRLSSSSRHSSSHSGNRHRQRRRCSKCSSQYSTYRCLTVLGTQWP